MLWRFPGFVGLGYERRNMKTFILLSVLLVLASSSHKEEFTCKSGESLPVGVVCDFKDDCPDGSDEEFCGTCDFERHSCGWTNTSATSYSWRRQMANISLVPGEDHTTQRPWGHVMHINGSEKGGMFPEATMEYLVVQQAALACQISFWYHIYDDESPSTRSTLQVKMIRGTAEESLLEISDGSTNGWENATVLIGNQPGGFKLSFFFSPQMLSIKDVMLDDIRMDYCGQDDVPPESDLLSCDFEKDMCSWFHDYTASLMWKRRKDKLRGLTANGYYMVIEADKNMNISSTARLKSIPQSANEVICVSFWYHIFGNSIGSLKFISKRSGEPETVVWMRSGTQGNKWRFADLTISSDKPVQMSFEAVVGGDQGRIAIDEIVVSSSESGSCPPERECTFQGSLCGLLPEPSADFNWERVTGTSRPDNSSGPIADHTLGTEQGYYLSAQLWRHSVGSRVAIMTAVMEPTPHRGECLMFWYYMEGSRVGELSVYLQMNDKLTEPIQLWTRTGDQGTHWRHGRVTLSSPETPYQVIFEAKAGDAQKKDIALDDLIILNGACPPSGFCDFEMDFCGWVNNPPLQSGLEWDWLSGSSDGQFVPQWDHTTESARGHFAFFTSVQSNSEKVAQLESETMAAVDQACLEMWHYSDNWLLNQPSHLTLALFLNESSVLHQVWNTRGFNNQSWIRERLDYSSSGPHQLVLQARLPPSAEGSISLDDIHITRKKSCDELIGTTTPPPTTMTTAAPASSMDCTFEKGLCNWVHGNNDLRWTLSQGIQVEQQWEGPQYDHTLGNNQGFFLLLNGSAKGNEEQATISVPISRPSVDMCVEFWYFMLGPSVSALDLFVQMESHEQLVWTQQGTQKREWMNAQVTIRINNPSGLKFAGHRNTQSRGFIAIDDITVREGVCRDQNVCGFDSGSCSFENSVDSEGRWVRMKGTKDHVDHTYGTDNGYYMAAMSHSKRDEVAQLLSPEYPPTKEMCVRFWYWLPADPFPVLTVHVLRSGELENALWQSHGIPSGGWEVAEVTVSSPLKFYVVFQAKSASGTNSTVRIDDYSVTEGACSPTASCDFESGQCTWVNILSEDGPDWVLARGGSPGPLADHTTGNPNGHFLLSSALHQSLNRVASEWIHNKDASICLTLSYHMENSHSGTLRVSRHLGPSEVHVIFQSNSSGSSWSRMTQSVATPQPFQLWIEAESINGGSIAVDDITLTSGVCQVNETSGGFVGCSFENGTCDWADVSSGQSRWVRGRNSSGNTGPSADHTLGSKLGWYMAVEAERGEELSPAALESPNMKQSSTICMLHFYYNMYGDGSNDLKVLLRQGSRTTALWWLSGNHGDSWQRGEVAVGRITQDLTIVFEASRIFDKPGHIALDDVDFTNCSLPEPQPSCPENMFTCNNAVCVDRRQVCDFSDDCGDWSDENNCEQRGVMEQCSFEQGLCFWAGSAEDVPEGEWTRHQGQEAWPEQGPPRDHTQNSAAGHYVIPGTHLVTGQTSEILSRTLLPSINCSVRFYYFSLNDSTAKMTTRIRTQHFGNNDTIIWLRGSSDSYSWQRAEVRFSSSAISKIVFRYELSERPKGTVALDDISFSKECAFDPNNSQLPTSPTSAPPTSPSTSTSPGNPCQDDEFFCWESSGPKCILAALRCNYHPDCAGGEDEADCGPCTFESDQCRWTVTSDKDIVWERLRANNGTEPPTDHTTGTGYYMRVDFSAGSTQIEAELQSPMLAPSSPYCLILFHFYISAHSAGSLRVLMQQAEGSEAILWSRSQNTVSRWIPEHLPLGLQRPHKVLFSAMNGASEDGTAAGEHIAAVDDISFMNCETNYQPPALSSSGCSFEDGLCDWMQGADDGLDWLFSSDPTESLNTGPAADHTTGKGKYIYMESSPPSLKGHKAQLKSLLLPPAGDKGYCLTYWYHMFGATVGTLKVFLQTMNPQEKTLVWQTSGNQQDEWREGRSHVTLQKVHQVILEATVGGEAGDIAVDDISFMSGPCHHSDLCDFEEGSCDWQQNTDDDHDWVRQSGNTLDPNAGPGSDHTTGTATGHYYYLPSSPGERAGQRAAMSSPLYPAGSESCVQLWYHISGTDVGSLNVYQQSEGGKKTQIFSQMGGQGQQWRFAQAALLPQTQPYRIVVEGVTAAPSQAGGMAFDDVSLTDIQCPPRESCDFETNMCSWSSLGGGGDHGDWLRSRGASTNPTSGPSIDHTTNSSHGYYVYVDSLVGQWGEESLLISDVFPSSTRGHCLTFWYLMYGDHVGTLKVYINDREMQAAGSNKGELKWIEASSKGNNWHHGSVQITHSEPFWFVFVYQRGMNTGGDVALDDITIVPHSCFSEPPAPSDNNMSTGLTVSLALLGVVVLSILIILLISKWTKMNRCAVVNDEQNTVVLSGREADDMHERTDSDFSFHNIIYDSSSSTEHSADA